MDYVRVLTTFVATANAASLSEAAHRLHMTPSAVSKHIGALEAELGVSLVRRTTRDMSLTSAGADYLKHAVRILSQIEEARQLTRVHAGVPSGALAISSPVTFGRLHVAPAIPEFLHAHPQLTVDLQLTDRQVNLGSAGTDVAIRIGDVPDSSMIASKLGTVRRLLCASPSYLKRYGIPQEPQDLVAHNCLHTTQYTVRDTWYFRKAEACRNVVVRGNFKTNNSEALREAVVQGLGLALLATWSVSALIRNGRLVSVLPEWRCELTPSDRNIYAVYPRTIYAAPKVMSFVNFLRTFYGSPPSWER